MAATGYHGRADDGRGGDSQTYKEVGYAGMLMPDHVPHHADDPDERQHFAFAYGYIIGLVQAAYATAG